MDPLSRRTLRNGAIGGLAGAALGFVPLITLVAPILGGGVAGYLERDGATPGALAGAIAGLVMAAVSTLVTGVILFVRFGDLPVSGEAPLAGLAIGAALSLAAAVAQVVVAAFGGALGGILVADRAARHDAVAGGAGDAGADAGAGAGPGRGRRWGAIAAAAVAGIVTFVAVGLAVSVVLEPFIWLSVLVGIPVGFLAGAAVAVLGYRGLTRGPAPSIGWRGVAAGALAVVLVGALLLGGLHVLGQQRIDRTTDSTYEYRVTLSADDTIEDATFYVPLPEENGSSALGEQFVDSVQYSRDTPALRGYDDEPAPVNFTYDLVETEHGPMLAISTDRIEVSRVYYREAGNETMGWRERIPESEYDPDDPSMGVLDDGSFEFTVTLVADDPIKTADPFGTEPMLVPADDRTEVDCRPGASGTERCYEFDSRVYAEYDTAATTTVYVGVEFGGRNEWFSGGWSGNEYRQRTATELRGPASGWSLVRGDIEVGVGSYRD